MSTPDADTGKSSSPEAATPPAGDGHNKYALDRDVVNYLVNRATDLVEERARIREQAWRGVLAMLLVALGWLGMDRIANFEDELKADMNRIERTLDDKILSIRNTVTEERQTVTLRSDAAQAKMGNDLERRMADALRAGADQQAQLIASHSKAVAEGSVRDLRNDMSTEIAYLQLVQLARALDEQTEPASYEERDQALALLQQSLTSKHITARPDFSVTIEHLMDAFLESGYTAEVTQVERQLGDLVERHIGIVISLMDLYSRMWFDDPAPSQMVSDKLTRYVTIAGGHRDMRARCLARVLRMLRTFQEGGGRASQATRTLLAQIADLTPEERKMVMRSLDISFKSITVGPVARRFREAHEREFGELSSDGES